MSKIANVLKKYTKLIVGILGLAIVIAWSGGFLAKKVKPAVLENQPGVALPIDAATVEVQAETAPVRVEVVGTTASEEKINLSARIPAYVGEIFASAGDRVKKGQKLIVLDDRDIRQQLAGAEAQLNQAKTEYERAKQLFEKEATTQQALVAAARTAPEAIADEALTLSARVSARMPTEEALRRFGALPAGA